MSTNCTTLLPSPTSSLTPILSFLAYAWSRTLEVESSRYKRFSGMLVMQRSEERQGIYRGGENRAGAQVVGAAAHLLAPP
jgi:hypothetical protein